MLEKEIESTVRKSLDLSLLPLEQLAKVADQNTKIMMALLNTAKSESDTLVSRFIEDVKELETSAADLKTWQPTFDFQTLMGTVEAPKPVAKAKAKPAKKAAAPKPVVEAVAAAEAVVEATPVVDEAPVVEEQPKVAAADDLTRISGVGPALAKKLTEAGYTSFQQIADLTQEQIEELEATVIRFSGRIERDDWKGQARGFVANPE